MAENEKPLPSVDTQETNVQAKIEIPIMKYIQKDEYENLRNIEKSFTNSVLRGESRF